MTTATRAIGRPQLSMPGMPPTPEREPSATAGSVSAGQQVLYLGNINGGPRHGSRGVVKQTLARQAVVDMGRSGTWYVPYFFLSTPARAA